MDPSSIRLSYTNPITGRRHGRDEARQFLQVDGATLEIEHTYRIRGLWTARLYFHHIEGRAAINWIQADGQVFLFASRRNDLLAAIANYTATDEWQTKRAAWQALPTDA